MPRPSPTAPFLAALLLRLSWGGDRHHQVQSLWRFGRPSCGRQPSEGLTKAPSTTQTWH